MDRKIPKNVADPSCELLDFNRNKYSNIGQYPGNDNRYPPSHEHGYMSAGMNRGMHVRASKMNGNLLCGGASILRCSAAVPRNLHSARASASVLRSIAPRLLTFTFCSSCLGRRADSLHNLLLTKLHWSIRYVHSFTCSHRVGSRIRNDF